MFRFHNFDLVGNSQTQGLIVKHKIESCTSDKYFPDIKCLVCNRQAEDLETYFVKVRLKGLYFLIITGAVYL